MGKLEVYVQYHEHEAELEETITKIKEHFIAKGYKEKDIKSIQVYIKPEDYTAYYVINENIDGKVQLF